VTKVAPDASTLIYSTFLDYAYAVNGIAALSDGSVFIAGTDPASTYPTTSGAFQQNLGGSGSLSGGFLTQLDPTGSSLLYSTVIGDNTYQLYGLALDPDGDIWLAGSTQSRQFPLVLPLQSWFPQYQSSEPLSTVTQFDPSGKTLKFSTLFGGNAVGYASKIAIDTNHRAHIAGASAYGMYTTTGVYAPSVPVPGPGFSGETFLAACSIRSALRALTVDTLLFGWVTRLHSSFPAQQPSYRKIR
jgi:hypothetical protein